MKLLKNKWVAALVIILILYGVSYLLAVAVGGDSKVFLGGNVALIRVAGMITVDGQSGTFSDSGTSSKEVVAYIEEASENPMLKAIVIDINSPGGTPVASKEIADALKESTKFTVCYIREVGASGAYWVASACDKIVANDLSITGSIGVIGSYLEFSGFLDKYQVKYERVVSGEYKDMGSPYKELTDSERILLQSTVDKMHDYFVKEVAANRGMQVEDVKKLATGEVFLGLDAKENGLVDELGDMKVVERLLREKLNITSIEYVEFYKERSFWDLVSVSMREPSYYVGKGIGDEFFSKSQDSPLLSIRT
ncbi:signal peptide peptidase SppA [Candidatus Woesearchaeota archaeon]|nr:signal peptide peptidase SppA [Candidatus Woesearchaeota archaeon]